MGTKLMMCHASCFWKGNPVYDPFHTRVAAYLFPVFLVLNGIHSTARFSIEHEVKSGIFAETTGVAQEGVLFIVVDRPYRQKKPPQFLKHAINFNVSNLLRPAEETCCSPALVALIHVLTAVATHPGVGRHRGTAARTLQGLGGGLVVLVKVGELDHQVGCDDG